jgi:peptidoglycan/LPS O-acetylase OafA/YrhL
MKIYMHRYFRLTPVLLLVLMLILSLWHHFPPSPYFQPENFIEPCRKHFLSTILHIQTITNSHEMCYIAAWYLSVDFQLFIITPLLLIPVWRYGWKILFLFPILIVAGISAAYYVGINKGLMVGLLTRSGDFDGEFYQSLRNKAQTRAAPWIVGLMLGYQLYKFKDKKVTLPKFFNVFMWIISSCLIIGNLIALQFFEKTNHETSAELNVLFLVTHRTLWSCSIAWIIFSCHNNFAQAANKFLSSTLWKPLGKMGFSVFMLHRFIQISLISSSKSPIDYTMNNLVSFQ